MIDLSFTQENIGNPDMFEGDMILTADQRMVVELGINLGRAAAASKNKQWSKGVLVYHIDPALGKNV